MDEITINRVVTETILIRIKDQKAFDRDFADEILAGIPTEKILLLVAIRIDPTRNNGYENSLRMEFSRKTEIQ